MKKLLEFTEEEICKINKCFGVYFLFDDNKKLVYIGRSKNLRYRLSTHYNKQLPTNDKLGTYYHNQWIIYDSETGESSLIKIKYFSYKYIDKWLDVKILEGKLIDRYEPILNDRNGLYIDKRMKYGVREYIRVSEEFKKPMSKFKDDIR